MFFSDIYGQETALKNLFMRIEQNKVSHAYIFEGSSGVGRFSTAKAFASALVCDDFGSGGQVPCGNCKSCLMSRAETHPDIIVVTNELYGHPNKESKNLLADTVRNMKNDVYIKPYASKKKVYIIPNADTQTVEAQNSLLKVLEEPPEYCVIILIAQNANLFLQTILSRSSIIKFSPLSAEIIEKYLNEKVGESPSNTLIAKISGGSIGRAVDMLGNDEITMVREKTINHLYSLSKGGYNKAYDAILYLKSQKKNSGVLFSVMQQWFEDVLILKQGLTKVINADKIEELKDFAAGITKSCSLNLLDSLVKYMKMIDYNANYNIAVTNLILDCWEEIHDRRHRNTV